MVYRIHEGTATTFPERIKAHARGMQQKLSEISGALGETVWSIKSDNFLPVTNDSSILQKVQEMVGGASGLPVQKSLERSAPVVPASTSPLAPASTSSEDAFESSLWFQ